MAFVATCGAILPVPAAETAGASVRSGLQVGERITSIFEPLNVTGPYQGERHCLVCENGVNPVVMIFARDINASLEKLLIEVDRATAKHQSQQMGSFLVLLGGKDEQSQQLSELARRHQLKHLVLSVDELEGPPGFAVAPNAEFTAILYRDFEVKANYAFSDGGLPEKSIPAILADLPKILTSK